MLKFSRRSEYAAFGRVFSINERFKVQTTAKLSNKLIHAEKIRSFRF